MNKAQHPMVECPMMIRKPISEVFQAFVDPKLTTMFWFTKSSGKLEKGKTVTWEWEMYGIADQIKIVELLLNEKIIIEWDNPTTTVEFEFLELANETTYVIIKNYGFHKTGNDLIEAVKNNTGGFTTVLDGLKAYLEFGIKLNLVKDKFPQIQQK